MSILSDKDDNDSSIGKVVIKIDKLCSSYNSDIWLELKRKSKKVGRIRLVTEWYPVGRHEERKGSELVRVENKYPVDMYEERKGADHVREKNKLIKDTNNQTVTK